MAVTGQKIACTEPVVAVQISLSLYSAMLRGLKALADVAEIRGSEVVEQGCV